MQKFIPTENQRYNITITNRPRKATITVWDETDGSVAEEHVYHKPTVEFTRAIINELLAKYK